MVDSPKTALLIVDVQHGLFNKAIPLYQADQLLSNLNALIRRARKSGAPVIFMQHQSLKSLPYGTQDWQLHPKLEPPKGELVLYKQHGNAFEETHLQEELAQRGIRRLVVAGLVTHGCVRATCLAALNMGYQVLLVKDGHSSYNKDAAELIEEWNAKLGEAGADVKPAGSVQF